MARAFARVAAPLLLTSTALLPREASGFCRTTTIPIVADFQPRPGRCWTQGLPLFWRSACVGYSLQRSASRQIDLGTASNAVAIAFSQWTRATCPSSDARQSRTSIDVRDLGPVDCGKVDYSQTSGNQNVIVFRDDAWPHADSNNTLALTTISFNPDTGEIYDGDMELNTADVEISFGDAVSSDGYDFESIVTHETGHFLGLAHSGDANATMYASYDPGNTAMRRLTSDDVAGICEIYRADGNRSVADGALVAASPCDPTPRRGFSTSCSELPRTNCIGSARVASSAPTSRGWLALGGLAWLATCARRRARRQKPTDGPSPARPIAEESGTSNARDSD